MKSQKFWLALALAGLCTSAGAQQEVSDEADQPAAPASDWTAKPVPALQAPLAAKTRLLGMALAGQRLVAVGQQGVIVTSDDAGKNWTQMPVPVSQMLTRVRFKDATHGWAVGYDSVVLKTTDGGRTWSLLNLQAGARPLYDIVFLDEQRGIAVGGYGTYLATADGGKTWSAPALPLADLGLHFNAIRTLEDGSLVLVGEKGLLAHSTDGGANWKMLKSPYIGSFFGVQPLGGRKVMAYGMRGHVFIADDIALCPEQAAQSFDPYNIANVEGPAELAKLGWRLLASPSKESLFGADLLPGGEVLLVGVNGTLLKTEMAANRLQALKSPASETLTGVLAYKERLIAVGKRGAQDLGEVR